MCTFSKEKLLSSQINNTSANINDGKIWDKDYVGMSDNSSISYDLGTIKPNEIREFELYIYIDDSKNGLDSIEKTVDRIRKLDFRTEYEAVKKYWKKYLKDHNGLELDIADTPKTRKIKEIYTRTILLYALLVNNETGGISAAVEIDETLSKCGGYDYCWPRDAVFITYAMDILKMKKEVEKFYKTFCKTTQSRNGMWEQRFFTDGRLAPCWGYQIDETASVIFGIYNHYKEIKDTKFLKDSLKMCEKAMNFLKKYITDVLEETHKINVSYDLWEMHEGVSLYSIASIFAAFTAMIKIYEALKEEFTKNRVKQENVNKEKELLREMNVKIKELEKEIEKLKQEIEKVSKEKEEYEESIEDLLEEITSIEQSSQEIQIEYATEKQRIESLEESILNLETRLESLKTESKQIEQTILENEKQKSTIKEKTMELEKEIEAISGEIQAFAEKDKENQKYIDDLNFEITNLKISLSSFDESNNSMQEILERIETELQANTSKIESKQEQSKQVLEENEKLKKTIENLKQSIKQIKQEVSLSSETVEKLKQKKIEKNNSITKTEIEIEEKYGIIEEIKNQTNKLEVKKSKIDVELEQVINKMWEDYEITPNTVGEYKKPNNIAETTKNVKDLREKIKELGSINIDSIEEYKQTKERYDYMCEQRLDLENSSNKLKKVIQDMTKIMKEQFEAQFKTINKNFGEVFKELFGGGKAELRLTDEEDILNCGIEIEVQPPGKKLQNMSLLSGGERAFTAIALLFAILKINPAPFCVLDEIEAALDDVNVYRFADYLKKFTQDTQFLVITHRKGTMEASDTVYGITMEESGISKLLSMKLEKK